MVWKLSMGMPLDPLIGLSRKVARFQMLTVPLLEAVAKIDGWMGLLKLNNNFVNYCLSSRD